ncbi:MAG: DegV family EDD domain-containing protein [Desulfobulbus sp.]|jgi:DegV family protein with EDD domain|uniref:DegV family protein n=1 Tax=Desulfobulbus sp. TaxID=895 RepID=UPI0028469288|nr:DegV family protein [Desulfobulbus sp.]MDR2548905.1 DegV family EDD domain-containing protein [Desulfobulbus sp.]
MTTPLAEAFAAGYAGLSAWSDLLDRINVFPVADADTGANLRISLGPLRACGQDPERTAERIIRAATGNSGNIAAAFFGALLGATGADDLAARVGEGCGRARQAVADPRDGTMLTVFDALSEILARCPPGDAAAGETVLTALRQTVLATAQIQADCRSAGVVDAGALGMYIFFDGFFRTLTGMAGDSPSLFALFPGRLALRAEYRPPASQEYCVDLLLAPAGDKPLDQAVMADLGESLVVVPERTRLKIHVHTPDPPGLRSRLAGLGEVAGWSAEPLDAKGGDRGPHPAGRGCLHILTDAAGSLPRPLARRHGIGLVDSYIVHGDTARPESLCDPETIYALMRLGHRLTTAQASLAERHRRFRSVCEEFGRTLYLCVGSAFTGNHGAALAWQRQQDREHCLETIDTGAASGRLGLIALLAGRLALRTEDADAVRAHALRLVETCREYVFIDTLRHLVAGGRVSRASGLFGDFLHLKPVISPTPEGVRKVGLVRSRAGQLAFALDKAKTKIHAPDRAVLLLQYSDNESWVREAVQPQLRTLLPGAEILTVPLSLTSGVHMGPGTWSLAFAEEG